MFPCTTLALIGCFAAASRLDRSASGLRIALYAWGAQLLLIALPILRFHVDYSFRTDVFVALCLVAQTVGYLFVRCGRPRPEAAQTTSRQAQDWSRELHLSIGLALAGIAGNVLLLLSADASLNFEHLLTNLEDTRLRVFEELDAQETSFAAVLGNYLAAASILSIIAAVFFSVSSASIPERFRPAVRLNKWLAVANFLLIVLVGLLVFAGRTGIVYALALVALALVLRGKRLFKLTLSRVVIGAVVLGVGYYFATAWLVSREVTEDPAVILEATQRAEYHPLIASAAEDSQDVGFLVASVGYFASPIQTLSYYLEQDNLPGPYWGQFSYPTVARNVHRAIGTRSAPTWIDLRHEVFWPLERTGYHGNVWSTWLRDLYVDFGYVGAIAYLLAFGALVALARNRFEQSGSMPWHYLEVLGAFVMAFGAFVNTTWNASIFTAFLLALGVLLIGSLTPDLKRRHVALGLQQSLPSPTILPEGGAGL